MNEQYVYVARLLNHKNEFLEGYYKLGKSKQYSIREKQLNSTNMPFDVLLVRVFGTDNMASTEAILHTCFEDYRIVMVYDDKKKKRTEWFYVDDEEVLYNRIDKLIKNLPNTTEIDLTEDIKQDTDINDIDKAKIINTFRNSKTRLSLIHNGEDISQENSTETYMLVHKLIADVVGWDKVMEKEIRVTKNLKELSERNPSANPAQLKPYENHFIFTGNNNEVKVKNVNKLLKHFNITNIQLSIKK